jgi:diguanylate cyclase (GGDEF)-like protein
MQVAQYPYTILLVISALVSGSIALFMWLKRKLKGVRVLAVLMLEVTLWAIAYLMMWSSPVLDTQVFWLNVSYFGELAIPVTFLVFTIKITNNDDRLTKQNILLLCVEPIFIFFVIWTNKFNYLFNSSYKMTYINSFPELSWVHGPGFWVGMIYSYVLIVAASIILARAFLRAGPYSRTQLGVILFSSFLPWGINFYTLLASNSLKNIGITPIAFTITGILFAVALSRLGLQNILPIARNVLIETITDGVLVLDMSGHILDINPAAQKNISDKNNIRGKDIRTLYPQWKDIVDRLLKEKELHTEIRSMVDTSVYYDLVVAPLVDKRGRDNGRLITFRDISQQKRFETKLEKMNARLRLQVKKISTLRDELREQAIRDPLTGLFNRRYLTETLERELSLAKRKDYPVSIIMIDIDHFKNVNDTYGHKKGDQILSILGKIVRSNVRSSDIPCRFGGEEFVIVMPETTIEIAEQRAHQIRRKFRSTNFFDEKDALVSTLSIGVATFPDHGDNLESILNNADQAMYLAKTTRDAVVVYEGESHLQRKRSIIP